MRIHPMILVLLTLPTGCSHQGAAPRDPGSPTPIADPRSARQEGEPSGPTTPRTIGRRSVPVRADQAPLIRVRDALDAESLLGRRVRVAGRCIARGEGRRAGSWTLDQAGAVIEVRGLVPSSCGAQQGSEDFTIFAQIERQAAGSRDRILLRLPD